MAPDTADLSVLLSAKHMQKEISHDKVHLTSVQFSCLPVLLKFFQAKKSRKYFFFIIVNLISLDSWTCSIPESAPKL